MNGARRHTVAIHLGDPARRPTRPVVPVSWHQHDTSSVALGCIRFDSFPRPQQKYRPALMLR